jgi:hypothetical protein
LIRRLVLGTCLTLGTSVVAAQAPGDTPRLPPGGFGTQRQDDASLRLAAGTVELRLVTLDERIIRLMAPDTYAALHRLLVARSADIDRAALQRGVRRPSLFLVTFFGREPRAPFTPEDVTIISQNRLFRPVAIVPLAAHWSELMLRQRETASAIYLFEEGIALLEPMTVSYGGVTSNQWEQMLRVLEQERARVYSRAAAAPRQP